MEQADFAVADVPIVPDVFTPPVERRRIAPCVFRVEKDRSNRSGGRIVSARIVENPNLPGPPEPPTSRPLIEGELTELRDSFRNHRCLGIGATVYNGRVSRFYWSHEGERYVGWSNIDFRLLQVLGEVRKGDMTYGLFLLAAGYDDPPPEYGVTLEIPEHPKLPDDQAAFVVTQGDADNEEALDVIVALHEVYVSRKDELQQAYGKRQELGRQYREWREANPPQPRDIKVNLWRR